MAARSSIDGLGLPRGRLAALDTPSVKPCEANDTELMHRCFELARLARTRGEAPYAAVISWRGAFLCQSGNMATAERDATRHAELVAICEAQRILGSTSLDDCTLYSIVEPCPMCAYAMRETRVGRVVYSLRSPVMGGHSRWNILCDEYLSESMPDVFASPPIVVAGYMTQQAGKVMQGWSPLFWRVIKRRHLMMEGSEQLFEAPAARSSGFRRAMGNWFRTRIVDRIRRS